MRKRRMVLGALLLLCALLSCRPPLSIDPAPPAAAPGGSTGASVRLEIPYISPRVARDLGIAASPTSAASRAVIIVNRAELELYLLGELNDSKAVNVDINPGWQSTEIDWQVPAASGYTIAAKVYNTNVSSTTPILYGVSAPFDVIAGGNVEVTIRPIPDATHTIAPLTVPQAPSTVSANLDSSFDTGTTQPQSVDWGIDGIPDTDDDVYVQVPVYGFRDEAWFKVTPPVGYQAARVKLTPSSGTAAYFLVADSEGYILTSALSGAMQDYGPAYWTYGGTATAAFLTPGSTYYVGAVTISNTNNTSVPGTLAVSYEEASDDVYEDNDTFAAATTIVKSQIVAGIDLDPTNWDGDPAPIGGDWYKFQLDGSYSNVTIKLVFDQDVSDLVLMLFDASGTKLVEKDASTFVNEFEQIDWTLTIGNWYYIWVGSDGDPVGAGYQLQWVSGLGTITIGLQ